MIKKILLIIFSLLLFTNIGFTQTGTYTTNGYFYLPAYGEYGIDAFNEYETYMQIADTQIEYNKNNLTADDLSDNTLDDLSDVNTTGWASGKVLKFDASGNLIVGTDESGTGATTFVGLTDTPADYTGASNKFVQVNSTSDALIFDTISSDDLTDRATIAMTDENEIVTGDWEFKDLNLVKSSTSSGISPFLNFYRANPNNPDDMAGEGDIIGDIYFLSGTPSIYDEIARITAEVGSIHPEWGTPSGILKFKTYDYNSAGIKLRSEIDGNGNIKMGDGAWTNYVNITNAGVLTLEGTANIEGVDATEFSYLDGVTSDIQTQFGNYYLKTEIDTQTEMETIWGVTLMNDLIDDTTPELGGNLDVKDKNITGAGSIGFTQELDNGSKTTSFSVDFSTDQKQKCTLTANTITLTLDTTNVKVGNYLLKIVNGGLATLTWASETGSVYWPGGTKPTLTSSGTDIVTFYFDGTNFYAMAGLNFK